MAENYKVADLSLAESGKMKIEWAEARMPVLLALREQYAKEQPLKGQRIAGCLHVTKETAVLIRTLRAAGAEISWSGCNPLSTSDEIAAALAADGLRARVVSMPSVDRFLNQPAPYQADVLPVGVPVLSVEAGVTFGWAQFADDSIGIDRFGASAPGNLVLEKLGLNVANVVARATALAASKG